MKKCRPFVKPIVNGDYCRAHDLLMDSTPGCIHWGWDYLPVTHCRRLLLDNYYYIICCSRFMSMSRTIIELLVDHAATASEDATQELVLDLGGHEMYACTETDV